MSREQTVRHAVIGKRDGSENQHRHNGVNEIREPNSVPLVFGHFHSEAGSENGQTFRGDEAVVDFAVGAFETVGEVEEEAGESAEGEKGVNHESADGGAEAVSGDRREEHLERQEGSGGKEVDEHRRF